MLDWSIDQTSRPVVIRVPEKVISSKDVARASGLKSDGFAFDPEHPCNWRPVQPGRRICFLTIGTTVELAQRASRLLGQRDGIVPSIVEALSYGSFDEPLLDRIASSHDIVVTLEPGILCGGFGEKVARYYGKTHMRVLCYGGKKELLDRVPTEEFFRIYHFTAEGIVQDIENLEM